MAKSSATPRRGEPISFFKTQTGEARYRTTLDYAMPGEPRQQRRRTFDTLTEARAHVAEIKSQRKRGLLLSKDRVTFNELAEHYLADRKSKVRPITYNNYVSTLKAPRAAFGSQQIARITANDIEGLVRQLADAGRTRRTVQHTLTVICAVLDRAVRDGAANRNVARGIESIGADSKQRSAMTEEEYQAISKLCDSDRLAAAWGLVLHGMRRSEVLGLRWQDIAFTADEAHIRIAHGRTSSSRQLTPPKTRRGLRELPLDSSLRDQLKAWRTHLADSLGISAIHPDAFVVVDAGGEPVSPEWLSDEWNRLCKRAGIKRKVVLHEARHTSVTLLRGMGVPDRIVAAWHGHDETLMRAVYDHAGSDVEALTTAGALLSAVRTRPA